MRWSLITIARASPRLLSSRTVVERLLPRRRADDRVLLPVAGAQVAAHRGEHLRIVVDDEENGLVHDAPVGAVGLGDRQRDAKLRAARLRLDRDLAVVVLDEPADDVEAEARTLPRRLGREERIEDPVADLGGNAGSVVGDPHDDRAGLAPGRDLDPARLGDGVERVVDQVPPDLVELAGEPADAREIRFHADRTRRRISRAPSISGRRPCCRGPARGPPAPRRRPGPCA